MNMPKTISKKEKKKESKQKITFMKQQSNFSIKAGA